MPRIVTGHRVPKDSRKAKFRFHGASSGHVRNVVAIVIALVCLAIVGFLIRTECVDQEAARPGVRRDRSRIAQLKARWVKKPASYVPSPHTDEAPRWPPSPAPALEDEAATSTAAEIGAWGSAWLAPSRGSQSHTETKTAGKRE
jgi:hypothetical protein